MFTARIVGTAIEALVVAVVVSASAAFVWGVFRLPQGSQEVATQTVTLGGELDHEDSPILGPPNARVAVFEFSDFDCPFCAKWAREVAPTVKDKLLAERTVLWVFKHLPLLDIHPEAERWAHVAACAHGLGVFSEAYAFLFSGLERRLESFTPQWPAGASTSGFTRCVSGPVSQAVRRDVAEAEAIGINRTPSFVVASRTSASKRFVVQRVLPGAVSTSELVNAVAAVRGDRR